MSAWLWGVPRKFKKTGVAPDRPNRGELASLGLERAEPGLTAIASSAGPHLPRRCMSPQGPARTFSRAKFIIRMRLRRRKLLRRRLVQSLQPADRTRDRAFVVTHDRHPSHVLRRCTPMCDRSMDLPGRAVKRRVTTATSTTWSREVFWPRIQPPAGARVTGSLNWPGRAGGRHEEHGDVNPARGTFSMTSRIPEVSMRVIRSHSAVLACKFPLAPE